MVTSPTRYFQYNYAEEKPEEFARVALGSAPLPIIFDDQPLVLDGEHHCFSAVSPSGEIVFEIPNELWFRHESGQVVFNVYTQQTDPDEHGRDLQIMSLEFESIF